MKKYLGCIFVLFFLLSGCLSPVSVSDGSAYLIKCVPHKVPVKRQHGGTILVMPPNTAPIYNTRSMAYSNSPYKISYYAKNNWAAAPSDMLLPLIVKTLQKTRHYKAVVSAPFPGHYNYLLNTEITELLQDFTSCTPVLKFSMRAQLSNGFTGQIIAAKDFTRNVPMRTKSPYAGVLAANEAVADVLSELAEWLV